VSSYINPDFAIINAFFNSLLQTTIKANFYAYLLRICYYKLTYIHQNTTLRMQVNNNLRLTVKVVVIDILGCFMNHFLKVYYYLDFKENK
jgi:hypothetical protein